MKIVFLNAGLVEALRAFGKKLDGTEGVIDLDALLTRDDMMLVDLQTSRLLNHAPFKTAGLITHHSDRPQLAEGDDEFAWDVFLGEGSISPSDTKQRLTMLNCVASADDMLILFEDESNVTPVRENMLNALTRYKTNDDIMKSALWKQFLKSN